MRILADALRKFRNPHQLHVVQCQAKMALRRGVYVCGLIRHQHRHVVDAVRAGVVSKVYMAREGYPDRLQPQAESAAQHAARQRDAEAHAYQSPNSDYSRSTR